MAAPQKDPVERYAADLKLQEQESDTSELQFYELSPCNKLLFTITPQENGMINAIGYSVGPDDASVNGYAHIMFSRILNPNMYATVQANNQTMWNRFFYGGAGNQGFDQLFKPLYLHANEPFYIQLVANYPAGTHTLGNLTLYIAPTFR